MIENHPQEDLLIRYADGLASPPEIRQVQALIEHDQDAAVFVKQLEQTQDWLNSASEIQLDKPSAKLNNYVQNYETPRPPVQKNNRRYKLALAATLLFGFIGGALVGAIFEPATPDHAQNSPAASTPEWVRLVADYHRLYDRETVVDTQSLQIEAVSAKLSTKLGRGVAVPDLKTLDMEFKREQSLSFDGKPIVQLVYLPKNSRPIAICILASMGAAQTNMVTGNHADMQYAYWQDNAHAVMVVGELSKQQLDAVVNEVESTLFSAT